jgi:hypothetical protein
VKSLAVVFTVVGMGAAALPAIGGFFAGGVTEGGLGAWLLVGGLGVPPFATHWLNWKWLRDPDQHFPRWPLLAFNLVLLALFGWVAFAFQWSSKGFAIVFDLLVPLPLALNAIYLCTPTATGSRQ